MTLLWCILAKGEDSPFWLTFLVQNMLDMISGTPFSAAQTVKPMEMLEDGQSLPFRVYAACSRSHIHHGAETEKKAAEHSVGSLTLP